MKLTDRIPPPEEKNPESGDTNSELRDDPIGLLGAALVSAGFGTDGSLPADEPEPAPRLRSDHDAETKTADARRAAPLPTSEPQAAPVTGTTKTAAKSRRRPTKPTSRRADETPKPSTVAVATVEEEEEPISPYEKRGSWYVIHAYSGYEKKVKANLATRTSSLHMQDSIFEVVIPTEKVVEIKGGRKVEVEKRMFPGYLLIRMYLDDDSWLAVRNTPGVTSFVGMGSGNKPTSLSKREVERFLGLKKEAAKKPPRFRPAWEIGETVRVSSGPFADFNGVVEDINVDQQKVTVLVEIFGRDTPMELGFEDIQKQ